MRKTDSTVITGGYGFLGWHVACLLKAKSRENIVRLGKEQLSNTDLLLSTIRETSNIIHLAGVNRSTSDEELANGNIESARILADSIQTNGQPLNAVFANSIQSDTDTVYGTAKRRSASIIESAVRSVGGKFANVILPNIFGEHGKPYYNSFVATFCHQLVTNQNPTIIKDTSIPLLHSLDAAECLVSALGTDREIRPAGTPRLVSEVLANLQNMHSLYDSGYLPDLSNSFDTNLFNTYRSYLAPNAIHFQPHLNTDPRGTLFETLRTNGGTGQAYVSSTLAGRTRGEHFHLRKFERFVVLSGVAEIQLRKLFSSEIVSYHVSGESPMAVDMPTLWVHNITNVGNSDLWTMFWSNQILDESAPDQYYQEIGSSD